jgi:hypothetical protein
VSVSAAPAFKSALFTACQTLYGTTSDVLVIYGASDVENAVGYAQDIVMVGNVISDQSVATMSTNRSREEALSVEVEFWSFIGGTDQQTVTERCYALVGELETYLQDAGVASSTQITLGGTVRDSRVLGHELEETFEPEALAQGRFAHITATVGARVRI